MSEEDKKNILWKDAFGCTKHHLSYSINTIVIMEKSMLNIFSKKAHGFCELYEIF